MIPKFITCLFLGAAVAVASPRLDFAFGILEESRGNTAKATELFEKARLAEPKALPLVQRAVGARLANQDRAAAAKLYRDLAAARTGDLGIQLTYADFLSQQSRGDSLAAKLATETLETALKKFPQHPEIIQRLFQYAQAAGNKSQQIELLEKLDPNNLSAVMTYASLAKSLYASDDTAAREKLDARLLGGFQANLKNAAIARRASDHFHSTGRTEQAIKILKQHTTAAPSSLDLRTRLGVLCFAAKQDAEGAAALKSVLEIHPRLGLAHQALAKFYRLGEKTELARLHASETLKIRGGSPDDFLKLAGEWLAAEQPREARLLLEKAIFDHPTNYELASKLAIATHRDPEKREYAARLFREAESLKAIDDKTDPEFLLESAETLISQNQSKAAEERLRAAIRAYPADAKKETAAALRRLAKLWENENRNADAARSLRQRADGLAPEK